MPDAPDWYIYQLEGGRHLQQDIAELAARLDSPNRYDRRGQVVWWDDFRFDLAPWTFTSSGTGSSVVTTASITYWGPKAARLTAGSDGASLAELDKFFSVVEPTTVGLEITAAFVSDFVNLRVLLLRFDGTTQRRAELVIDFATEELLFDRPFFGLTKILDTGGLVNPSSIYQHLKFVVDFRTNRYQRGSYNDQQFSLLNNSVVSSAAPDIPQYRIVLQFNGRATFNDVCKIGYVIITAGEPV